MLEGEVYAEGELSEANKEGQATHRMGVNNLAGDLYHSYYTTPCQELSSALGEWLSKWRWDWWATFTFRREVSPEGAKKAFTSFLKYLPDSTYYFMAIEWHKQRFCVHIHALVGGVVGVRRLTCMDLWHQKYGIARIYAYDPKRGARQYLGKYLSKGHADWTFDLPLDRLDSLWYNRK